MTDRCLDTLELGRAFELPSDDPRRRHLDGCARCRGVARALGIFLEPGDTSDLEGLDSADAELKSRLSAALPTSVPASAPRPRHRRFGLAMAAVLALFAIGVTTSELLRTQGGELPQTGRHQRGADLVGGVSATTTANGVHLTWPDAPPADSVVYVFLSREMSELGRQVTPGTLDLNADDPLALAPFCQALAVAQGDTVGRSPISRLAPVHE